MGSDFIVIVPLLLSHCGFSFVFGCGVSFFVSSSVFLSMIVQLVVILVFSKICALKHQELSILSELPYQKFCLVCWLAFLLA